MSDKLLRQILSNQINIMLHLDTESNTTSFSEHINKSLEFFIDKDEEEDKTGEKFIKDIMDVGECPKK